MYPAFYMINRSIFVHFQYYHFTQTHNHDAFLNSLTLFPLLILYSDHARLLLFLLKHPAWSDLMLSPLCWWNPSPGSCVGGPILLNQLISHFHWGVFVTNVTHFQSLFIPFIIIAANCTSCSFIYLCFSLIVFPLTDTKVTTILSIFLYVEKYFGSNCCSTNNCWKCFLELFHHSFYCFN